MTIKVNGIFPGELKPNTVVGGCIEIFENVWPNPNVTIQMAEDECRNPNSGVYWERATTLGNGPYQNARTNKMLGISYLAEIANNPALQNIHNQMNILLLAATIPYAKKHGLNETLWHESYSLLKYSAGEEYKEHYDGCTQTGRIISCLIYLNNDFEGGEIEFPAFQIKIKPQPGMLILFPSNFAYRHVAHPIISGEKYCLVTWIKDRQIQ
jgi:hypothetical protein